LAALLRSWIEAPHVGVLPSSSSFILFDEKGYLHLSGGCMHKAISLPGSLSRLFAACCMNGTLYYLLATIGCQWLYGCTKRSSMRAQYNLQESPCLDCCVHFWCGPCALCQEYKELEKRGFNMAKGIPSPSC